MLLVRCKGISLFQHALSNGPIDLIIDPLRDELGVAWTKMPLVDLARYSRFQGLREVLANRGAHFGWDLMQQQDDIFIAGGQLKPDGNASGNRLAPLKFHHERDDGALQFIKIRLQECERDGVLRRKIDKDAALPVTNWLIAAFT